MSMTENENKVDIIIGGGRNSGKTLKAHYITGHISGYAEGYNKAIDDFAKALCDKAEEESIDVYFRDGLYGLVVEIENLKDIVRKIAEQMKGCEENG